MRVMQMLFTVVLCAAMSAAPAAQSVPEVKLPASPTGQAALQLGGTWQKTDGGGQRYEGGRWIVIDYGRPLLRGRRNIFGSGADYGKAVSGDAPLWRAGANATTRLTTQAPLVFGGKRIEPGVYAVFVDLKPESWALVLSTQPIQEQYDPKDKTRLFGAYNYDPKFEAARVPMQVQTIDPSVEQFTIAFINATDTGATLALWWEHTMATADFTVAGGGTK